MKYFKILAAVFAFAFVTCFGFGINKVTYAADTNKKYYTVYEDDSKQKVLFLKGD